MKISRKFLFTCLSLSALFSAKTNRLDVPAFSHQTCISFKMGISRHHFVYFCPLLMSSMSIDGFVGRFSLLFTSRQLELWVITSLGFMLLQHECLKSIAFIWLVNDFEKSHIKCITYLPTYLPTYLGSRYCKLHISSGIIIVVDSSAQQSKYPKHS